MLKPINLYTGTCNATYSTLPRNWLYISLPLLTPFTVPEPAMLSMKVSESIDEYEAGFIGFITLLSRIPYPIPPIERVAPMLIDCISPYP